MKKNIFYVVFALFMMLGVMNVDVYAADSCDLTTKTKLRTDAANVTINYEPVEKPVDVGPNADEDSLGAYEYYLDMKIYNINTGLKVRVIDQSQNDYTVEVTYKNLKSDGSVTVTKRASNKIANIKFEIYGSDTSGCAGVLLRTVKLTLPKYNNLAEREVCTDVPEFYMCQKFITYDVNVSNFKKELDEYKAKMEDNDSSEEDNNTITNKVATVVSNNKFVIVAIVLAVGIGITIYVLNKKRSVL